MRQGQTKDFGLTRRGAVPHDPNADVAVKLVIVAAAIASAWGIGQHDALLPRCRDQLAGLVRMRNGACAKHGANALTKQSHQHKLGEHTPNRLKP